jgi:hypothetical protein
VLGLRANTAKFPPFCSEIAGHLKIVELNIWDNRATNSAEAEAVIKIEITQGGGRSSIASTLILQFLLSLTDMCNVYGTMHGECAVFLFDLSVSFHPLLNCQQSESLYRSTAASIVLLARAKGFDVALCRHP